VLQDPLSRCLAVRDLRFEGCDHARGHRRGDRRVRWLDRRARQPPAGRQLADQHTARLRRAGRSLDPRYRALWRGAARRTRARALDGRDQARLTENNMEPIALDMHVHQIPIDADRLAKLPGVRWHADAGQIEIDGHKVAFASLFKPAALLEWLNTNAIAQA